VPVSAKKGNIGELKELIQKKIERTRAS